MERVVLFIRLSKDQQEMILADIQRFFYNQRDEDISEFEAERLLDFIKEHIAPTFIMLPYQMPSMLWKDNTPLLKRN